MARVLFLLADGFDDEEVRGLREASEREGHAGVLVGFERGQVVTGQRGMELKPDHDPLNLDLNRSDVVVVAGGPGADALVDNAQMVNVVYSVAHKGKLVVLVGRAVRMLPPVAKQKSPNPIDTGTKIVDADLVKMRQVTGDAQVREELEKAGARWMGGPVQVDGMIVTARSAKGRDLERLMEELAPRLALAARPVVSRIL